MFYINFYYFNRIYTYIHHYTLQVDKVQVEGLVKEEREDLRDKVVHLVPLEPQAYRV